MLRYIVSGAPGAGKTVLVRALRKLGYAVVDEAATDVIAWGQAGGEDEPWRGAGFLDAVARVQRERQELATGAVQVFDRSPICTLALARYSDRPVTAGLAAEVERVVAQGIYQRRVFFVRLLGFITPTAARRIGLADSVRFERFHEEAYREYGFELVDVPAGTLEARVELVDGHLRAESLK